MSFQARLRPSMGGRRSASLGVSLCCLLACILAVSANAVPEAVIVETSTELKNAVETGAAHIQITKHLDLSGLPGRTDSAPFFKLFNPGASVKSITVSQVMRGHASTSNACCPYVHIHAFSQFLFHTSQ